jgi:drug/metabolite transporter (DMT)-like permease
MKTTLRDYLQLHFVVLIAGFTAILGALISINSLSVVFFRTFLTAIGLYFFLHYKNISTALDRKSVVQLLATGSLIAMHWFTFFYAAKISTVAICLAGISTGSLWTSLLEPLWEKRKIRLLEVSLGIFAMVGLYLIFLFEVNHLGGLLMSIFSAFLSSLFSVINARFSQKHSAQIITYYEMIGAALVTFIPICFLYFSGDKSVKIIPQYYDWLWLLILAFVCTIYAFAKGVELIKKLSAFTFNLTLNLEPVYGIILAYIIFGEKERMTTGFYLGTLVILGSVLVYPLLRKSKI